MNISETLSKWSRGQHLKNGTAVLPMHFLDIKGTELVCKANINHQKSIQLYSKENIQVETSKFTKKGRINRIPCVISVITGPLLEFSKPRQEASPENAKYIIVPFLS